MYIRNINYESSGNVIYSKLLKVGALICINVCMCVYKLYVLCVCVKCRSCYNYKLDQTLAG